MPHSRHRPRRSQTERREQTRQALLDATLECLVEKGYPGTTTARIARRASVSVGALQHHFESKIDLLTAAIGHLVERRLGEFAKAMADGDPDRAEFDTAIDALWSLLSGPTFTAWVELWLAARTEPELAAEMVRETARFDAAADVLFAEWFGHVPGLQSAEERGAVLGFTLAALDGLALRLLVLDDGTSVDVVLGSLKFLSRTLFPQPDPDLPRSPT